MQNRSRGNTNILQQRFDAFEDNSISFNNDAAWDKLEQRREKPSSTKRRFSYWMAAATLTILCVISFLWKKNTTDIVKPSDQALVKETPVIKSPAEQSLVIINAGAAPVKIPADIVQKNEKKYAFKKEGPVLQIEALPENSTVVAETKNTVPVRMDSPAIAPKPILASSKRLKVVHLNELNASSENNTGIAQQEGRPYFPVSYESKKIYTNTAEQNIKKNKNNLVRIKLFP